MTHKGNKKSVLAIIPSAGMGRRMGTKKKNYLPLFGKPVLAHTLEVFEKSASIDSVVVVVAPSDEEFCKKDIVEAYRFRKVMAVVPGGAERQDSVERGLQAAGPGWDIIVVHDGARPLVTGEIIKETVQAAFDCGAAICAVPVKDTIKETAGGLVTRTVPREALVSVQTPQAFSHEILRKAFEVAREDGFLGTDESSLVERLGCGVRAVMGSYENIKITTPEDVPMAECILKNRREKEK